MPSASFAGTVGVVVVGLVTWSCCGCSDACTPGEYRCSGGQAENCHEDQDLPHGRWGATPCEGLTCVLDRVAGAAVCVESDEPEPGCGTATAEHAVCDGTRLLLCTAGGYLIDHEDCPACVPDTQPFCADSGTPDPLCTDRSSACDGTTLIFCHQGYRLLHYDCPDAGGCREMSSGVDAFCALEVDADPLCPLPGLEGRAAYCDGDVAVNCIDGYAVWRQTCAAGALSPVCTVEADGSYGSCPNGAASEQGTPGGQPPHP